MVTTRQRFEPVIQIIDEHEDRIMKLEKEVKRLDEWNKALYEQIKELQHFRSAIKLAFGKELTNDRS